MDMPKVRENEKQKWGKDDPKISLHKSSQLKAVILLAGSISRHDPSATIADV